MNPGALAAAVSSIAVPPPPIPPVPACIAIPPAVLVIAPRGRDYRHMPTSGIPLVAIIAERHISLGLKLVVVVVVVGYDCW